jgi:hypothetical protein
MLGQIQEWFYHDLAGIQNAPDSPGFKKIIINPQPVGNVTWTKASFNSIRGKIISDWKLDGGKFTLDVTIPANTTATVCIPSKSEGDVTEGGNPASQSRGVSFLHEENGRVICGLCLHRQKIVRQNQGSHRGWLQQPRLEI